MVVAEDALQSRELGLLGVVQGIQLAGQGGEARGCILLVLLDRAHCGAQETQTVLQPRVVEAGVEVAHDIFGKLAVGGCRLRVQRFAQPRLEVRRLPSLAAGEPVAHAEEEREYSRRRQGSRGECCSGCAGGSRGSDCGDRSGTSGGREFGANTVGDEVAENVSEALDGGAAPRFVVPRRRHGPQYSGRARGGNAGVGGFEIGRQVANGRVTIADIDPFVAVIGRTCP